MVVLVTVPENNPSSDPPRVVVKSPGKMMADPVNSPEKENVATAPPKKAKRPRRKKKSKNQEQKKGEIAPQKEMKGLTPYQGSFCTCGMFHCHDCKREWFSAHSWADTYQKCKGCNKGIYPYKQFRHWKSEDPKKEKGLPHPMDMCQKCMLLGYPCVNLYVDRTRGRSGSLEREE